MVDHHDERFVTIDDAAELTGFAPKYLRKLARLQLIEFKGSRDAVLISWESVKRLASQQKPFWVLLPDSALDTATPDPGLLINGRGSAGNHKPVEFFHDKVELGNCIDWMRQMPPKIIQSTVTSPPYWGVRKYPGAQAVTWSDGSHIGLGEEPTVEEYVRHSLEILRHLKRVLRDDGTIWWNLGDTYQTRAYLRESSTERIRAVEGDRNDTWSQYPNKRYSSGHPYLKDKDLALVPFLVALGAERLGYYVRSVIVWYKDNTVPEPVADRPTTAHEYILLLAKSRFYKYDKGRAAEASVTGEVIKRVNGKSEYKLVDERNLRSVWQFPPSSKHGGHTAAFPLELPLRCLTLSTTPGDLIFDPFAGSGTSLAAAKLLGCRYFGCDVVSEFVRDAERRLLAPSKPLTDERSHEITSVERQAPDGMTLRDGVSADQLQLLEDTEDYTSDQGS